jgi:hypothetical protein
MTPAGFPRPRQGRVSAVWPPPVTRMSSRRRRRPAHRRRDERGADVQGILARHFQMEIAQRERTVAASAKRGHGQNHQGQRENQNAFDVHLVSSSILSPPLGLFVGSYPERGASRTGLTTIRLPSTRSTRSGRRFRSIRRRTLRSGGRRQTPQCRGPERRAGKAVRPTKKSRSFRPPWAGNLVQHEL